MLKRILREWFTGTNNIEYELGRALWAMSFLAMIAYQGIAIFVNNQDFDPVSFGGGVAAILAAGGAGVAMKDRAHPRNQVSGDENANSNSSS
jgi:NO-binding membrane sensor protein with MHYT domain